LHVFLDQTVASAASVASFEVRVMHAALLLSIYPVYLYFNFSGYTDFVIGCALLFGLKLPENFQRPFSSTNFLEFWSRWHISLSNWLKTYVYNPLLIAMVRRVKSTAIKPFLAVIAYLVTFFLVGAWHGQTPEFLFFGVLQGGGVSVNKLYQIVMTMKLGKQRYSDLSANRAYAAICRGLTFTWFGFTLLWFWSNWGQLGDFIHWLGVTSIAVGALVVIALATIVLQQGAYIASMVRRIAIGGTEIISSRYMRTACTTAIVVVLLAVAVVLQAPAPEIVYKAF
jgi:D-alanyl-lipoteichoic acid acyltransferase DltB (MBOAT superfamily)